MPLYRLPQAPVWGFYLGTFVLALVSVFLGDLALGLALRLDRKQLSRFNAEVVRLHNLSLEAIEAGDRDVYRASNRLANEAFGRMFFLQAAFSLASLWPLPFALAWMQYRFFEVELPLWATGFTLGYTGIFLPLYLLARILWVRFRPFIPFVRDNAKVLAQARASAGRMRGWADLMAKPSEKASASSAF
ncbi:MAG: hypothetical protein AB1641_27695 [Thermodesulfobacteriota bacterium]